MKRTWKIDGAEVPFTLVIKKAREYGYESNSGIYQTSVAVEFLEENGHSVECAEDWSQE